jgi:ribosomal protein S6--L-glutamate ligase
MHIGLLSVSMNVYSTRRLLEEARIAGHSIEQIDHSQCSVVLGAGRPRIYLREEDITHAFDAIISRIGLKVTQHGAAIVKQFEMNGVFSTAKALSIARSRNKVRALQLLSRKGIPIPKTLFFINPENIDQQMALLGGAPVIIKTQEGTQGMGVILADSEKSARSILETLYRMDANILLQEYIGDSKGEDIRTVVVGQKIVASMKRTCEAGDFRSNVHRGATTAPITLGPQERQMALNATKHLGLGVAGVDIIPSKKGPLLLEVNASPGLQGIEAATGVNVAGEIIRFIEKNARSKRK